MKLDKSVVKESISNFFRKVFSETQKKWYRHEYDLQYKIDSTTSNGDFTRE